MKNCWAIPFLENSAGLREKYDIKMDSRLIPCLQNHPIQGRIVGHDQKIQLHWMLNVGTLCDTKVCFCVMPQLSSVRTSTSTLPETNIQ